MGPKKKNKKGEKEKAPKTLRSEYIAKIAERNALLAEARRKIQKVEDLYFSTEKRHQQTQEDMTDVIKYLQHEIEVHRANKLASARKCFQENELEIAEFDEKIAVYKKEMRENDKYYQAIFTKMQTQFEDKERELQSQLEQNVAKLSAFDEVRQMREEYLRKKEEIYRKMRLLQERHQKEIYAAEKEVIIKQDTMQKEMDANLLKLAIDFRQASDIAIGETTNKLIRDNIRLGNMLTCTQEIFERTRDSYQKVNEMEKRYRYNAELFDAEHAVILEKYTKRVNSIQTLLNSHEELHEKIKASEKMIKDNRRLQRQIAEKDCILKEKLAELKYLMKVLNENTDIFNMNQNAFYTLRKLVFNLELSLYEAASTVQHGIEIENITHLPDEDEDAVVVDEAEQEDNLKEFKYKTRESAIEKVIDNFLAESDNPPIETSSELLLSNNQESILSENELTMSTDIIA